MAQAKSANFGESEGLRLDLDGDYDSFERFLGQLESSYGDIVYLEDKDQAIPSSRDVLVVLGNELFSGDGDLGQVTDMLEETGQDFVVPSARYGSPLPAPRTIDAEEGVQSSWVPSYGKALYFQQ